MTSCRPQPKARPGVCPVWRMHELSVAQALVELVAEQLAGEFPVRVLSVRLRIGALSGVVAEALSFAYDSATAGTVLEGSVLDVEGVAAVVFCPQCAEERELQSLSSLRCPVCSFPAPKLVRGRELEVTWVEVADAAPTCPSI
jgi:hydrogenase nickel incorporation protein HypA/HybF